MKKPRVSPADFVKAWQRASCPGDVAQALGLTYGAVRTRATHYRKAGVPLQSFRAVPLDVDALTKIARRSARA